MTRLKIFLSWLYTLNHPNTDVYPITFYQRYYKYRIGFSAAWRLSKIIVNALKERK